jgi:hypothetical protein
MPQKMLMNLGNNNPTPAQINYAIKALNSQPRNQPTSLNAPMVSRIQGVRSGCGSCGRG